MRKRVLLIDESLTVQKVVALTLDKSRFSILYAKTRAEAMRLVRGRSFEEALGASPTLDARL